MTEIRFIGDHIPADLSGVDTIIELRMEDGIAVLDVTPKKYRHLFGVFENGERIDNKADVRGLLASLKYDDAPSPSPIWTGRPR